MFCYGPFVQIAQTPPLEINEHIYADYRLAARLIDFVKVILPVGMKADPAGNPYQGPLPFSGYGEKYFQEGFSLAGLDPDIDIPAKGLRDPRKILQQAVRYFFPGEPFKEIAQEMILFFHL
jgi:hypothetical protein